MAQQSKVPVKIPPNQNTQLVTKLETVLPPDWLISAYAVPNVGHGIVIYGPTSLLFARPKYAFLYPSETKIQIERVKCRQSDFDQIVYATKFVSDLKVEVVSPAT